MAKQAPQFTGNRLLAVLSDDDRSLVWPSLEPVTLPLSMRLMSPGEPIDFVYFLEAGLGSDVALSGDDRRPVECGLIGREGVIGAPALLRSDRGIHISEMQIAGHGLRIRRELLWDAMDRSASLRNTLHLYVHWFMSHTAQTAACNARHSLTARLARWLLMSHDRVDGDMVSLTHEYLAIMLGVRRAGVTQAIHVLEGERLIRGLRGRITVSDRSGLEARSCMCYGIVGGELDRVFSVMSSGLPQGKTASDRPVCVSEG